MCTVSVLARENGYALGMNRDEKLARVPALPPQFREANGRRALFPCEPGGGAWVGVNDAGAAYALINWYAVAARVTSEAVSRGFIVRTLLGCGSAAGAGRCLVGASLERTNPFRLIGVFPRRRALFEWRWDLTRLERVRHPWQDSIWISSGFDEPGAQPTRRAAFESALQDGRTSDADWLRKLHASHAPAAGPYSICMHRPDAATVSYTEIEVDEGVARLSYAPGPPCCCAGQLPGKPLRLNLRR